MLPDPKIQHLSKSPTPINQSESEEIQENNSHNPTLKLRGAALLKKIENYKPKNPNYTYAKLHQLQGVKMKIYKDSGYVGQFMNGLKQGRGIQIPYSLGLLMYDNGRIYEGEFQNDRKHGFGLEILSSFGIYEGQFVNGRPEGLGKFVWPNGESYDGHWFNGLKHGQGVWTGSKGDTYMGEWNCGKAEGHGVHVWINGDRYEGQFKNCLKHGHGSEQFHNGDVYTGSYVNGKPDGYGEYIWQNGSSFKGLFLNGLRHGQGTWKRFHKQEFCDTYTGEYVNDKKSGYGIFQWANGNIYKGNFFDDLRHGYGELYWTDSSYYKGMWNRGQQQGEGELRNAKGQIKHGVFQNNKLVDPENNENIEEPIKIRLYSRKSEINTPEQTLIRTASVSQRRPQSNSIRKSSDLSKQWVETTLSVNFKQKALNESFQLYQEKPKSAGITMRPKTTSSRRSTVQKKSLNSSFRKQSTHFRDTRKFDDFAF